MLYPHEDREGGHCSGRASLGALIVPPISDKFSIDMQKACVMAIKRSYYIIQQFTPMQLSNFRQENVCCEKELEFKVVIQQHAPGQFNTQ